MNNHLKEVLENCVNYDFIINHITDNDELSKILIKFYQDYVFYNWSSIYNIKMLDTIIFEFINDSNFNSYMHDEYKDINGFMPVFDSLLEKYNKYQKEKLEKVDCTKWI